MVKMFDSRFTKLSVLESWRESLCHVTGHMYNTYLVTKNYNIYQQNALKR